jgi:cobalt/nickel transport system permease protein
MLHANAFDRFVSRESLVHRLDARVKVAAVVAFILSNLLLPDGSWWGFLASLIAAVAASLLAGLGAFYAIKRSLVALPFALAAFTTLFSLPGQPLWAGDFGPWYLVISDTGLLRFASILLRSWLSVQMAILLVASTPFPDILHALRHLRVPDMLVSIISFMYRYLFVLVDETLRLLRAREARSARQAGLPGGGSLAWRAKVAGNMAGQLFLRSYDRSDQIFNAMKARGYTGHPLTLTPHKMEIKDWVSLTAALVILLIVQGFGRI